MREFVARHIPQFDLSRQLDAISDEIGDIIPGLLKTGNFILGDEGHSLEQELAEYCDVRHAIGVANGTDALLLAIRALGVGPGDEVITSPFTFVATAEVVSLVGARPVFVDIDPITMNLDPALIDRAVTTRTRAIIPVHLFGHPVDMGAVERVARAHGLQVVEDACQAIGAEYKGKRAGSMGILGCFSFYPTKNLGCFGDGGLITTNDDRLADVVRRLRNHGSDKKYYHGMIGHNSRLDEIQAAILRVKLKRLEAWTEARRARAAYYDQLFREGGLNGRVRTPEVAGGVRHVYHQYTIRVAERDRLQAHLAQQGVGTATHYPLPLHLQEVYRGIGYFSGSLPVAEAASREVLSLPMFPELTREEQEYVVEQIARFFRDSHS